MAIDLKNVNISLDEFQRISSGWYNAGEVKLHDANTLDKTNNHVATWWYDNKDEISHAETVALDGTVTSTPLTIEPPPQPANP